MKKTTLGRTAVALAALATAGAHAEGLDLKVSGYGTVAAAVTSDHELQFHRNLLSTTGVSNAIDMGNDSRFGLQAALKFNEKISFTGQVVAQRRINGSATTDLGHDKDLSPGVEWLYLQYEILPSLNVRLGRTATPSFLLSDSLNVGYAAPWLRAPVHIYASQLLNSIDGVQLNWRDSVGGFNLNAQGNYGKADALALLSTTIRDISSQDTYSMNFSAEKGSWLARIGTVRLNTPSVLGTIHDKYMSAGMQYDDGDLVVMTEVAQRKQNKFSMLGGKALLDGKYGYLAAGYRFGPVLPMLIYSGEKGTRTLLVGGAPSVVKFTDKTPGLSVRYDAAPNVALKAQVDRYKANDITAFVVPSTSDRKVNVFTIGADFVF